MEFRKTDGQNWLCGNEIAYEIILLLDPVQELHS
jgi:hypothetical protein